MVFPFHLHEKLMNIKQLLCVILCHTCNYATASIPFILFAGTPLLVVIVSFASGIDGYGYPIYEFVGEEISKKYR